MIRKFAQYWIDARGNVAIIFGLVLLPIVILAGMTIDYGRALGKREQMQGALDAAVLAGAVKPDNERDEAAKRYFERNFVSSNVTVTNLSFVSNRDGTYTGRASGYVATTIASILKLVRLDIAASSTARAIMGEVPCINLLDPHKWYGLRLENASNIDAPECEVHVHSDRKDASAGWKGISAVRVKRMCLRGGTRNRMDNLQMFCAVAPDTYAQRLPDVPVGACQFSDQLFDKENETLEPGVYCGVTTLSEKVKTATFRPGLYIFKGGDLVINARSVIGNGVTFYFADDAAGLTMTGVVQATLTAPDVGTYKDILMFQPTTGTGKTDARLENVNGQAWTGIVHLPSWDIRVRSARQWHWKVNLIANSLDIRSISNWTITPNQNAPAGEPIGAVLVK